MANTPADAGSDTGLAGAPPPVHHQGFPRHPGRRPGHRAPDPAGGSRALRSLPYLIVLAGVAAGLSITWQGSRDVRLGTGLVGGALLAAAAARLLLPPRYTKLLSSRWKASDVLAFTVLGAGVLAIALALP
jgi:hypothetical protein